MADSKLTSLSEVSVPALSDFTYSVNGTPTSNKASWSRILGQINRHVNGRLTLTTAVSVTTSDVTGAGTIYFTPYQGNIVSIYDGTRWKAYTFTEKSLSLTLTSGNNYDVFIYDNAGTLTLELSAAWTNDTTRADALVLQDGIYVKSGATSRRYLGTIRASGTNTTEDSKKSRLVWNYYNRVPRSLLAVPTDDTYTYSTATWRACNGVTTLGITRVDSVIGLAEDTISVDFGEVITVNTFAQIAAIGIGVNSTSVNSSPYYGGVVSAVWVNLRATYKSLPTLGYSYYQMLEISQAQGGTNTWYLSNSAAYRQSAMTGTVLA